MCRRHWAQVPTETRLLVWRSWHSWQRTNTDGAWAVYMENRQAALDHFTTQPDPAERPSDGLTWPELDDAALVLVVATDGTTRMWFGGDREKAAKVLQRVWTDLATRTAAAQDVHP